MVGVVENRIRCGTIIVDSYHIRYCLPTMLCCKRHDGGVTAKGGRHAAAVIIIRCHRAGRGFLCNVAVCFNATWHHIVTGCVYRPCRITKIGTHSCDLAVTDADVRFERCTGIDDGAASDDGIKCRHASSPFQFV